MIQALLLLFDWYNAIIWQIDKPIWIMYVKNWRFYCIWQYDVLVLESVMFVCEGQSSSFLEVFHDRLWKIHSTLHIGNLLRSGRENYLLAIQTRRTFSHTYVVVLSIFLRLWDHSQTKDIFLKVKVIKVCKQRLWSTFSTPKRE